MKKVARIICTLISVVTLSLLLAFALSPDDAVVAENVKNLDGTWRVYASTNGGVTALVENEFLVLENGQAVDYRDGAQYVTSAYTVDGDKLDLADLKQTYHIAEQSANCMRLYQSENTFLQLVRAPGIVAEEYDLSTDVLSGRWDITYRPKENQAMLEQLGFEDDIIFVYRNGAPDPAMQANWTTNEAGYLCVAAMGKELRLYKIDDTAIVMVERTGDVGSVWELTPVAE